MPATAYTANLIAKAMANGTSYQGPATIYLALVYTLPDADTAGTEITQGNYSRKSFNQTTSWTDDGAGTLTNTSDIEWPLATADYDDDVVAVEAWTQAAGGTRLWYIVLEDARSIVSGQTPKFYAGDLALEVS